MVLPMGEDEDELGVSLGTHRRKEKKRWVSQAWDSCYRARKLGQRVLTAKEYVVIKTVSPA